MSRFLAAIVAAFFVSIASVSALAQGTVLQRGAMTPGHVPVYQGQGGVMDAGKSDGTCALNFNCGVTDLPIVNSGQGLAAYSAQVSTGTQSSLKYGFDGAGNGLISFSGSGKKLYFSVNGVTTQFSLSGIQTSNQFYVNGATGSNLNDCRTTATACRTINGAIAVAATFSAGGLSQVINIAAGTYAETVFATSQPLGALNSTINQTMISLAGASSSTTTITGDGVTCGTIVATNNAIIGLQGLRLNGNAAACQSTLFAQQGGIINIFSDVVFGPASQQHMHAESSGSEIQIWNSYSVNGNAQYHWAAVSGATILGNGSWGTATITATTISAAWALADSGGVIYMGGGLYSGNPATEPYVALRNGTITNFGSAFPGGNGYGEIHSGGRYSPPTAACLGGSGGICPAAAAPTGLGTGGTIAVLGSTRSGVATITAGSSGTGSAGIFTVFFDTTATGDRLTFTGGASAPCVLGLGDGTGIWQSGSVAKVVGQPTNPYGLNIGWFDGGATTLSTGSTYFISWICQSDF